MHAFSFRIDFALSNNFLYITFQVHSVLTDVNHLSALHTPVVLEENLLKKLIISRNSQSSFLFFGCLSVIALSFCGSAFIPWLDITLPKNGTCVHLK